MSEKPYPDDPLTLDLIALLKKRRHLPTTGIVEIVLRECPTWNERYGEQDHRGMGFTLGNRLSRMKASHIVTFSYFDGKQFWRLRKR